MKLYMCIREKSRNQIHKIKKELVQCHHAKSSQRFIFSDAAWPLLGSEDRKGTAASPPSVKKIRAALWEPKLIMELSCVVSFIVFTKGT